MPNPTPFDNCIAAFGNQAAIAHAVSAHRSTVCRWGKPVSEKGTGGRIPTKWQAKLLKAAQQLGLNLTAEQIVG